MNKPRSLLFVCTHNAVRSPMAEGLLRDIVQKKSLGTIDIQSAGLIEKEVNGFAISVMKELGINIHNHEAQTIYDLDLERFDKVIALSKISNDALNAERDKGRLPAFEFWPMPDPSKPDANREQQLASYRELRDQLQEKVKALLDGLQI